MSEFKRIDQTSGFPPKIITDVEDPLNYLQNVPYYVSAFPSLVGAKQVLM